MHFLSGLGQWVTNPRSKLATRWKASPPRQRSQDASARERGALPDHRASHIARRRHLHVYSHQPSRTELIQPGACGCG